MRRRPGRVPAVRWGRPRSHRWGRTDPGMDRVPGSGCAQPLKEQSMCLAIPGQIIEIPPERSHLATVDVSGVRRSVNIMMLADEAIQTGDWVLIHVGFAMAKID